MCKPSYFHGRAGNYFKQWMTLNCTIFHTFVSLIALRFLYTYLFNIKTRFHRFALSLAVAHYERLGCMLPGILWPSQTGSVWSDNKQHTWTSNIRASRHKIPHGQSVPIFLLLLSFHYDGGFVSIIILFHSLSCLNTASDLGQLIHQSTSWSKPRQNPRQTPNSPVNQ